MLTLPFGVDPESAKKDTNSESGKDSLTMLVSKGLQVLFDHILEVLRQVSNVVV